MEIKENTVESKTAIRILGSGTIVQFLGVTATLFAFFIYQETNKAQSAIHAVWPIAVAYILALLSVFRYIHWSSEDKPRSPLIALRHIYWYFIIFDAFLLAALVYSTGGPKYSLFTPIFLLIPTVAGTFCKPNKFPFLAVAFIVSTLYATLFFVVPNNITIQTEENASKGLILTGKTEYWFIFFTIACIATAVTARILTAKVRKGYCSQYNGDTSDICVNLYY